MEIGRYYKYKREIKVDIKTKVEFLRVATMIGQKLDVIWTMFITTYLALYGFAIFYDKKVNDEYFIIVPVGALIFTYINGRSLYSHYDLIHEMGKIFKKNNHEFPDLNKNLGVYIGGSRKNFIYFTHTLSYLSFVYLVFDKFWDFDFGFSVYSGG